MRMNRLFYLIMSSCLISLTVISACSVRGISGGENKVLKEPGQDQSAPGTDSTTISPEPIPSGTPEPTITESSQEIKSGDMIQIKVVFDNYSVREDLNTAWGFAAYITYQEQNVLFDTGADGQVLLHNMTAMNIDPSQIQKIVLSHQHNDHTNGLQAVLSSGSNPGLYLLPSFSSTFKNRFNTRADIIEVSPGQNIAELMYSTGEIQGSVPEQALVIDSAKGLVVITGCAHPGVENMVRSAKQILNRDVYLVMGGFHLDGAGNHKLEQIIQELQRLGVKNVAPCHCTGLRSINKFRDEYGDNFIKIGVGAVIEIEG